MNNGALQRDLMGVFTIWLRDVRRFLRDRPRMIGSLVQPTLFLVILGNGLGHGMFRGFKAGGGEGYMAFIFPGIVAMTILFTSAFSAISIIWDREVGFLKEVLVAPVSRWAVTVGKVMGGATVAMCQGCIMLLLAPVAGVSLGPSTVILLLPLMFLVAFAMTAMGIAAAARMRSMQGFTVIMNFVVLPIFFLSGAMFPLDGLPAWMNLLVHLDPLTYGVDLLRGVVIGATDRPVWMNLVVLGGFGTGMLGLAVFAFNREG